MDVGIIIKTARLEKGMTQEELAEKVGVKKSAVAKWENGRVSEIKRSNLARLAEALGLKPYELLEVSNDIKIDPAAAATKAADILLNPEAMNLVDIYLGLNDKKRKQVMDFIAFLSAKD